VTPAQSTVATASLSTTTAAVKLRDRVCVSVCLSLCLPLCLNLLLAARWFAAAYLRPLFDSSFFLGWLWSVTVFGLVSDRWGRRTALYTALMIFNVAQVAGALSPTAWFYMVARHFSGVGLGAYSLTGELRDGVRCVCVSDSESLVPDSSFCMLCYAMLGRSAAAYVLGVELSPRLSAPTVKVCFSTTGALGTASAGEERTGGRWLCVLYSLNLCLSELWLFASATFVLCSPDPAHADFHPRIQLAHADTAFSHPDLFFHGPRHVHPRRVPAL
jgi:MFS family permease